MENQRKNSWANIMRVGGANFQREYLLSYAKSGKKTRTFIVSYPQPNRTVPDRGGYRAPFWLGVDFSDLIFNAEYDEGLFLFARRRHRANVDPRQVIACIVSNVECTSCRWVV